MFHNPRVMNNKRFAYINPRMTKNDFIYKSDIRTLKKIRNYRHITFTDFMDVSMGKLHQFKRVQYNPFILKPH